MEGSRRARYNSSRLGTGGQVLHTRISKAASRELPGRATSPSSHAPWLADRTFENVTDAEDRDDRGGQRAQHEALPRPVGSTRDGFKVPDLARKHRPDLILMDIQLPTLTDALLIADDIGNTVWRVTSASQ
jgi:CheY-like chemotaxis protein